MSGIGGTGVEREGGGDAGLEAAANETDLGLDCDVDVSSCVNTKASLAGLFPEAKNDIGVLNRPAEVGAYDDRLLGVTANSLLGLCAGVVGFDITRLAGPPTYIKESMYF